ARCRRHRRRPERVGGRQPAGRRGLGRPRPRSRAGSGRRRPHCGADAAGLSTRPLQCLLSPGRRLAAHPRAGARGARPALVAPPGDGGAPGGGRDRRAAVGGPRGDMRVARLLRSGRRRRLAAPVLVVAGRRPRLHVGAVQPVSPRASRRPSPAGARRTRRGARLRALRASPRAALRRGALPWRGRRPPAGGQRAARRHLARSGRRRAVRHGPRRDRPGARLPDPRGRGRIAHRGHGAAARVPGRPGRVQRARGRGPGAARARRRRAHRGRARDRRDAGGAGRRRGSSALSVAAGGRARAGSRAGGDGSLPVRQRHGEARLGPRRADPVEPPGRATGGNRPRHRGHGRAHDAGRAAGLRPAPRRPVPGPRPVRPGRFLAPASRARDGVGLHPCPAGRALRRRRRRPDRALGSERDRGLRRAHGGADREARSRLPRPDPGAPHDGAGRPRARRRQSRRRRGQRRHRPTASAARLPAGARTGPLRDAGRRPLPGVGVGAPRRRRPRRAGCQRCAGGAPRARRPGTAGGAG
ncbi:MAG: Phytoene dehydrogenase and related proteins, partial [uncultured Solirubrobacteraceae bacterium]